MWYKKIAILIPFFFLLQMPTWAQTTLAFQGFEGNASDTWNYNAPTQAAGPGQVLVGVANYGAGYAKTGSQSMRAGGGSTSCGTGSANCINSSPNGGSCNNLSNGKIVQFNTINTSCLKNVQISVSHRSHLLCGGQGQGFDSGESLYFEVSLNGGAWTIVGTLGGFNNYGWGFATNPAGSASTVANPFMYNLPPGTNTVMFRTRSVTNRADEVYYVDDVSITTTSTIYSFPGTDGLWNGAVNTNWINPCNWDNRAIPTATTDVYIPNTASNICEIFSGVVANCKNLTINKSKLAIESFMSFLNVYGNLMIDSNGFLDMSLGGIEGGTLNLSGNWVNLRDETFFDEGRSTINFMGSINQFITVSNATIEAFYRMSLNKPSGILTTNEDIWIDPLNVGGPTNMLALTNGYFDLNLNKLLVYNQNPLAISRTGGGIISERTNNNSRITWKINNGTGTYIFPFTKYDGTYIPFSFDVVSGSAGDVTVATYATPANNLPWPTNPVAVNNLVSSIGLSPDNRDATVDRFWQVDVLGTPIAKLTFTYAVAELPVSPYTNPTSLKAQRYNSESNIWESYLPGQGAGNYYVTIPLVTNFSTWTLTNEISPLPIEILFFEVNLNKNDEVDLIWATASEINNHYFTIEKSKNGMYFESLMHVDGAGNSTNALHYHAVDENPFDGITYYRLKQTDYDGRYTYSEIKSVRMGNSTSATFQIFPNPANEHFYVKFDTETATKNLFILDINGKVVKEIDSSEMVSSGNGVWEIQRGTLAAGLYFISTLEGKMEKLIYK